AGSRDLGTTGAALDAVVARRTAGAQRAVILPLVTESDAADGTLCAIGNEWTRRKFDGDFYLSPLRSDGLPAASLVFVQSRDGNTVAQDPSTLGGGEADTHLIYEGLSRVAADAVLGGAGTLHGGTVRSSWHPGIVRLGADLGLPRHPMQIIATRKGMPLDDRLMFNVPHLRVALITSPAGAEAMRRGLAARPWVTPIATTDVRTA